MRETSGMFSKHPDKGSLWGELELLSDNYQTTHEVDWIVFVSTCTVAIILLMSGEPQD